MTSYETTTERTEWGSSVAIEETAKGPRVAVKVRVPDTREQVADAAVIASTTYENTITWLRERGLRGDLT